MDPESLPSGTIGGVPASELLAQIRDGDHGAFATLCQDLLRMLWGVAINEAHASDVAEEIIQDVLFWLWTHREAIDVDADIRVYLAVAVRNRARDRGKHRRMAEAKIGTLDTTAVSVPALGQPAPRADVVVEAQEFRAAYQQALSLLTERERVAVLLRWEEGWSFQRIGEVLSLSHVGVRKLILRVQAKIQEQLAIHRGF